MAHGGDQVNLVSGVEKRRNLGWWSHWCGNTPHLRACGCTSSDVVPRDASAHRMVRNHMCVDEALH
ncbi:hypothetical protein Scep_028569 [Stephania cephalantha]|uniref:Uncharacterized protein n=1 Tax=Stephania cephalantha TaxID=152367 RepID=A0AAP0HLX9_9MAGN